VQTGAQQGANSATFEQLREVIATETEARVTDVTRLEAKLRRMKRELLRFARLAMKLKQALLLLTSSLRHSGHF
jgi:hypothetical protein